VTGFSVRLPARRAVIGSVVALLAVTPAAAGAQGSGVPLGSSKKLSSSPPSTSRTASVTTTTSHTASATSTSSTHAAASSRTLPFTGADPLGIGLLGLGLATAGAGLRLRTRDAGRS